MMEFQFTGGIPSWISRVKRRTAFVEMKLENLAMTEYSQAIFAHDCGDGTSSQCRLNPIIIITKCNDRLQTLLHCRGEVWWRPLASENISYQAIYRNTKI